MLVFMITSLETIGDITATSDVSEQPVSGPLYMKRLKGGVLANGLNSFVSAVFNTFPNSCFGQNNGVNPADRRRQPLRRIRGRPDADRPRSVPGGERLRAAHP
ncbi:putative purine/xanthine transport protein [Klebsiella variicola]|uniref:Putative purine/xanthine transport protein n=1 Tax=Klebsiella variicola TaxID=244366 RepID=A0A7H4M9W2_KLEVA|nr:putative purine/xanthine transport protein [Klebsiella variicola]